MVSLSLLSVSSALDFLYDPRSSGAPISDKAPTKSQFIFNTTTILEVNQILLNAADIGYVAAGPILLAWSFILKALSGHVEAHTAAQSDPYENTVATIMQSLDDRNPIEYFNQTAISHCHALDTLNEYALRLGNTPDALFPHRTGAMMRIIILDLLKCSSVSGMGYQAEVMEPLLSSLLGGQTYWDIVDSSQLNIAFDPIAIFLDDNELLDAFLRNSKSRYPYESLPFLRLIHALSTCSISLRDPPTAITILEAIETFTYQLPDGFVDYETTKELENNNSVKLKRPVNLFEPRLKSAGRSSALMLVDKDFSSKTNSQLLHESIFKRKKLTAVFTVPVMTEGRIISDNPRIVFWFHQYSGLKYFGKLLETFLFASDSKNAITNFPLDRDLAAEIIDILASLLLSTSRSNTANEDDTRHVLESASSGLDRNHDIITVVFDIFEQELQTLSTVSGSDVPLNVLVSCVHFIHALIPLSPGRVWPLLSRSSLLGVSRGEGKMSTIVEGVELVSGHYDFLISCARLYESLVDDLVANAIKRRSGIKSSARFNDREEVSAGVPDHVLSKVILSFSRYLVEVLESSFSWRFNNESDRRLLTWTISTAFDRVLQYTFGVEAAGSTVPNTM